VLTGGDVFAAHDTIAGATRRTSNVLRMRAA
jgi:hypothetical protein